MLCGGPPHPRPACTHQAGLTLPGWQDEVSKGFVLSWQGGTEQVRRSGMLETPVHSNTLKLPFLHWPGNAGPQDPQPSFECLALFLGSLG